MILTHEQMIEFETVTKPVMEFLNNNCHPHVTVTINTTSSELSEGVCGFTTREYLKG
jgi:hypothetical protein